MIGKSYAKIAIVGFVLCLAMVLCASFARYRSEQSFIDGAENGFGIDGMYANDGATRPSMAILAGEDMEWQICNADQAAGVSNPAFIRTHTDECGKCPDEVDNQVKTVPILFLEYRRLASRIDRISSRNAGCAYRLARAGALRGQIPCLTKAVLPGTALVFKGQVLP